MNQQILNILAELSAQRAILVRLQALQILQEPDPAGVARQVRQMMTSTPTLPPQDDGGHMLDPATSDLLASMTDERIAEIMNLVDASVNGGAWPITGAASALT